MAISRGSFSNSESHNESDRTDSEVERPIELDGVKARQFLHSLARRPFVTLVLEGEHVKVYFKGVSESQAAGLMEEYLEHQPESSGD